MFKKIIKKKLKIFKICKLKYTYKQMVNFIIYKVY